jgi:hypothetical protein
MGLAPRPRLSRPGWRDAVRDDLGAVGDATPTQTLMANAAGVAGEAQQRPPAEVVTRSVWAYLSLSVLTAAAVFLWAISLTEIDLRRMNDLGLVSVLPGTLYIALALVTISFCFSLRDIEAHKPLVVANVLVLIVMLYGIGPIVEHEPKLAAAWRHAGVIEYITRTGHVDPRIDAYFDWPGFFTAGAFVTKAVGLGSAVTLARWGPIFFNFLFLLPLLVIVRTATRDERAVWVAVWFFYATNWVGQDYFSPQALSFFLYLTLLALVLRWFVRSRPLGLRLPTRFTIPQPAWFVRSIRRAARIPIVTPAESELRPAQRLGLMAVAIVVVGVVSAMHQLTPFAILLALAALVLANQTSARGLPLVAAVLTGAWITFMATAYLKGHLGEVTGKIGHLEENVQSNVGARLSGSPEHRHVASERLLFSLSVWGLGLLGAARAYKDRRPYAAYLLLAAAPFALVVLQPYGGEVVLRVYMFALPFVALLASSLFDSATAATRSWPRTTLLVLISAGLLGGNLIARYGNERLEYFTRGDVAATRELYRLARPGDVLVAGSRNLPWKFKDYDELKYRIVAETDVWKRAESTNGDMRPVVTAVEAMMRAGRPAGSYLIVTRSQSAYLEGFGYAPRGSLRRFREAIARSPAFQRVYANPDGEIFVLRHRALRR